MAAAFILAITVLFMVGTNQAKILETKLGKIRGKTETLNGKEIDVYLGIPYAEPPLGHLRFRKPAPKKPWTRTIDATEYGPSCTQIVLPGMIISLSHTDISEDCLNLNVYVPVSENTAPKAVMVWIHGGAYSNGQGMATPCQELALHGDIVCVTINYRLGIFGFLSTTDEHARGNFGLWDQHEALKWVKEHISAFGGDPDRITIFGESAGGSSVQHQAVTRYNIGLVKRAIAQSTPTFSNGFSISRSPLRFAKNLARKLNCDTTDNQDLTDTLKLVNCLRLVSAEALLNKTLELIQPDYTKDDSSFEMAVGPVEDGDFVPYGIMEYFSASKKKNYPEMDDAFGKIDWMIGSVADEGNLMLYMSAMLQEADGYNFTSGIPENIINTKTVNPIARTFYPEIQESAKRHIHDFYTHKADPIENTLALRDLLSDVMFHQHVVESSLAHLRSQSNTQKSATYAYLISHILSGKNFMDFTMGFSLPPWTKCAAHTDDIILVFGKHIAKEGVEVEWSEEDQATAEAVMTYWTNFAKTGNPNQGRPLEGVPTWEEYTKEKKGYINIGKQTEMGYDLLPERMKLWTHTIPGEIERAKTQKTEL
ncbi:liver carboxylesterase 1-like [Lingula anatina]|uniref:Carboxylic ester hydrolase n=1 Tax=Lingula anatina TaxID=7574 RepID=A0A1S3I8H4_LINAN|nr:liver carboxylesterase 1-like [Lingula anatina]|eukprot:XP_013394565.1 liver carboxylesterase 1-like [Lingula anatina]